MSLSDPVSFRELVAALATCFSLASTYLVLRTNRWLREHLERERLLNERQIEENEQRAEQRLSAERERAMRQHNETLRVLSSTYESGGRPMLDDLLPDERRDFSLMSSHEPSSNPNPILEPTQPRPSSRASGMQRSSDWSDDEEGTETFPPARTYRPPPRGNDR
jgi:hypothetical protein